MANEKKERMHRMINLFLCILLDMVPLSPLFVECIIVYSFVLCIIMDYKFWLLCIHFQLPSNVLPEFHVSSEGLKEREVQLGFTAVSTRSI